VFSGALTARFWILNRTESPTVDACWPTKVEQALAPQPLREFETARRAWLHPRVIR
jgi:hypothetical protein